MKIVDKRAKTERRDVKQRDIPDGTTFEALRYGIRSIYLKCLNGVVMGLEIADSFTDDGMIWTDYRPVNVEFHILPEGGEVSKPSFDEVRRLRTIIQIAHDANTRTAAESFKAIADLADLVLQKVSTSPAPEVGGERPAIKTTETRLPVATVDAIKEIIGIAEMNLVMPYSPNSKNQDMKIIELAKQAIGDAVTRPAPEVGGERPAVDPNAGAMEALTRIHKYASRCANDFDSDARSVLRDVAKMSKWALEGAVHSPAPAGSV